LGRFAKILTLQVMLILMISFSKLVAIIVFAQNKKVTPLVLAGLEGLLSLNVPYPIDGVRSLLFYHAYFSKRLCVHFYETIQSNRKK